MDITVRPGDSLWYYSQLFRVPLQLIIDSNRDVNLQVLSVGQRIRIPGYVAFEVQINQGDIVMVDCAAKKCPSRSDFSCESNAQSKPPASRADDPGSFAHHMEAC